MTKDFEKSSTRGAVSAIYDTLETYLQSNYEFDSVKSTDVTERLLQIHGLAKSNFDVIRNVETFLQSQLNDKSFDDNANKSGNAVKGILKEAELPFDKIVGFRYLYRKLVDLYGKSEAKRLTARMYALELGLSDSSNIMLPYCWALDASKLVLIGRDFGQLQSKPAKRISSYISALCETLHQGSNLLAGAIAVGSFFLDIAHLCLIKEFESVSEGMHAVLYDKRFRKYIENEFQQFVHSVNHLSRNAVESPFTNISILDKPKIKALYAEYSWYFIDKDGEQITEDAVIQIITELQNIFLDLIDAGDPSLNGMPYRFPIVTVNVSKNNSKEIDDIIEDKEFVNNIIARDIYRYNIFASEGCKVSSCCRMYSDSDMMELAGQVNSFGGGSSISLGSHRVCTMNTTRAAYHAKDYNDFLVKISDMILDSAKILSAHKQLMHDLAAHNLNIFIKKGFINLNRMFSTIGLIGLVETQDIIHDRFEDAMHIDVIKDILDMIDSTTPSLSAEHKIIINVEQIPGESFARRLAQSDKIFVGPTQYNLYSNQFVPLWEDTTLYDKLETEGKYVSHMTGGCIVHFNLGERVTSKQAYDIIEYAIQSGVEHFALNSVWTMFQDDTVLFGKYEISPQTNSPVKDYFTRIVGFFVPVSSWNEVRREWEFPKRKFKSIS